VKILFILNDPPYGTERCYNALRLARSLLAKAGAGVRVFLLGDAAACAAAGQSVPRVCHWRSLPHVFRNRCINSVIARDSNRSAS
jgi:sulfur relay (sulfurtransferase) complex TusBCD TusD component (DsrE family)